MQAGEPTSNPEFRKTLSDLEEGVIQTILKEEDATGESLEDRVTTYIVNPDGQLGEIIGGQARNNEEAIKTIWIGEGSNQRALKIYATPKATFAPRETIGSQTPTGKGIRSRFTNWFKNNN